MNADGIVLALAAEDRYALYEVLGELGAHLEGLSKEELRQLATNAIRELAAEGLIVVTHSPKYGNTPAEVASGEVGEFLLHGANWNPPAGGGAETFIEATDEGDRANRKQDVRLNRA